MTQKKKNKRTEQIKQVVEKGIQMRLDTGAPVKFSALISRELDADYDTLNIMFQSMQGCTLETFIMTRTVEKVKELLVYTDQSLKSIAQALGFSVVYLSGQLKDYTGFSASYYKQIRRQKQAIMKTQLKKLKLL